MLLKFILIQAIDFFGHFFIMPPSGLASSFPVYQNFLKGASKICVSIFFTRLLHRLWPLLDIQGPNMSYGTTHQVVNWRWKRFNVEMFEIWMFHSTAISINMLIQTRMILVQNSNVPGVTCVIILGKCCWTKSSRNFFNNICTWNQGHGPTLAFEHKWNLTSQLDKLRLSCWLVTLASGPSSNYLTSVSLSSQLVKSNCMVTPIKSHPQAVPRTLAEGYWGGGQVMVMAKTRSKSITFIFLQHFFGENDVREIIFCEVLYHDRPHFDSAVLLRRWRIPRNNLRTVREVTCLSLWTVCSCLYIPMFY